MTNPRTKNRFSAIWRVVLLLRASGNRTATASDPPRELGASLTPGTSPPLEEPSPQRLTRHESAGPFSNRRGDVGGEGQEDQEQDPAQDEEKEFLAGGVFSRSVLKASRSDVSGVADADLSGGPVEAVPDRHVRVAGVLGPAGGVEELLQQEPRSAPKPQQAPHHQGFSAEVAIIGSIAYDDRLLGPHELVEKPKQEPSAEQEQRRGDVRLPARGWRNGTPKPTPARSGGRTGSERSAVAELSSRLIDGLESCSLTSCAASSGWKDKCHKAGLTCENDGTPCQDQCCDPIMDCSIEYGTDALCAAASQSSGGPPILQWEINGVAVQRSKVQVDGCCQGMTQNATEAVYTCGGVGNWPLASTEDTVEPVVPAAAITSAKIRFSMSPLDVTAFCVVLRSSDGKDFLLGMDGGSKVFFIEDDVVAGNKAFTGFGT